MGLFCFPRQLLSFSEWPQDWRTCLPSLPLLQSVISTQSLSASLDSLQHKDLFSQHTADLRVFKVSSASKRRKQAGRKKNNKIMALLKPPVECEWISASAFSRPQHFSLGSKFFRLPLSILGLPQIAPSLGTPFLVCFPTQVLEILDQVEAGWILDFKKPRASSQQSTLEEGTL